MRNDRAAGRRQAGLPGRRQRQHPAASDDRIGLATQIAAHLLPEVGESGAVDGGEGRCPGVELRGFESLTLACRAVLASSPTPGQRRALSRTAVSE